MTGKLGETALNMWKLLTTGVLMALMTVAMPGSGLAQKKARAKAGSLELSRADREVVTKAIAGHLINPRGAKYTWPILDSANTRGPRPYCGTVNAINAAGRSGGARPYLAYLTVEKGRVARAILYGIANRDETNPVTAEVLRRCSAAGYRVSLPPRPLGQ